VIGHSVERLTTITTFFSNDGICGTAEGQPRCTVLSVKYTFDTHSSTNLLYPIMLQASGIYHGSPFRGSYRLVFDKNSLTYLAPSNMPEDINPSHH
jgi:hypothetical protein